MASLIKASRYVILLAVVGALFATLIVILYGVAMMVTAALPALRNVASASQNAKSLTVDMIEAIDILLLGTILYIIAAGLYELFIGKIDLPSWLVVNTLDDLKNSLLRGVIVLMAVTFLARLVEGKVAQDTLMTGLAAAAMIVALTYAMHHHGEHGQPRRQVTDSHEEVDTQSD